MAKSQTMAMLLSANETVDPLQLILLAGVVVVIVVIMVNTRRRTMERGHRPEAYAREQISKLREQSAMRDDISELMVQLQELAREINAQVDTRFAKLEKALADADARIAELKRLGAEQEPESPAGKPESDATTQADPPDDEDVSDDDLANEAAAEQKRSDATPQEPIGPGTTDQPEPSGERDSRPQKPSTEDEEETGDDLDEQVIELARSGVPAVEIARRMGRHVGEIELIIKLKGRNRLA